MFINIRGRNEYYIDEDYQKKKTEADNLTYDALKKRVDFEQVNKEKWKPNDYDLFQQFLEQRPEYKAVIEKNKLKSELIALQYKKNDLQSELKGVLWGENNPAYSPIKTKLDAVEEEINNKQKQIDAFVGGRRKKRSTKRKRKRRGTKRRLHK